MFPSGIFYKLLIFTELDQELLKPENKNAKRLHTNDIFNQSNRCKQLTNDMYGIQLMSIMRNIFEPVLFT